MSNDKLPPEHKLPQKVSSHVDVLRVLRTQWALCRMLRLLLNVIPKPLMDQTNCKIPIVVQCTSLGVFVFLATALTAFAMSGCVWFAGGIKHPTSSRKVQSPSGTLKLIELLTGWKRRLPTITNANICQCVFNESLLRNRQNTTIQYISQTDSRRMPPQVAQVVDWDNAAQILAELIAPTISPHRKSSILMYYFVQ